MKKKTRLLIGKVGLDGHTTGIYAVSRCLCDAGIEVVFGGIRVTTEHMVNTAVEEAVDAIGISILSGAHLTVVRKLIEKLEEKGLKNLPVIVGGIVPPDDIPILKSMGVREVFTPGTAMSEIVDKVKYVVESQ